MSGRPTPGSRLSSVSANTRLTNGSGQSVNFDVPFNLTGLPLFVSADFSDPGVHDHQTATHDWGDDTADTNSAFMVFDEAFSDGTGALSQVHAYALSGSYPLTLSVADNDGGVDTAATTERVLTAEQAVEDVIDLLDVIIAGTANGSVRKELQKARKALAGSNGQSNNGTLAKISSDNAHAAIAFLRQALDTLRKANAGGADVGTLIALLEQVVAALEVA